MKKVLVLMILVLVVLSPSFIFAQASSSSKLVFDQPAATLVVANGYVYKYYPDGATVGIVFPVVCTGTTTFVCSGAFPAFTPGTHNLTISASDTAIPARESPKSAPFTFTFSVVPGTPVNIRIG